jgi:aspartate racemase
MGPAASAEFLAILSRDAPAENDQEHPCVLMIADPSVPDRSQAILGLGEDPTPQLRRGLERLIEWGADILAVPCNTAHFFIDRFRDELRAPLVHIVEETLLAATRKSPDGAWLLSTSGTRKSDLYPACARRMGYEFLHPSDERQERVQETVTLVKAGKMAEAGLMLRQVVEELWEKRDALIVTACTELPLAWAASGLPAEREVSSLQSLSDACLARLYEA